MKTRIITGVIMALVAILVTLLSPTWLFATLTMIVMLLAFIEWAALVKKIDGANSGVTTAYGLPMPIIALIVFLLAAIVAWVVPFAQLLLISAAAVFWAGQVLHILKARRFQRWMSDYYTVLGGLLLIAAWYALSYLHSLGAAFVLGAMMVVWVADSGAFFAGRRFGKKPLAAQISPNKTLEGVYGGMISAAIVSFLFGLWLFGGVSAQLFVWVMASVVAAIVSVVGDLFESYLKRQADVKDSGNLLPGHGGILDRVDGLLAAMPVFLIVWLILT